MGFIITIIVLFLICVLVAVSNEKEQQAQANYKSLKDALTAKYGEPTKVIDDYAMGDNETVYVFEQPQVIVIKGKEYSFDSLLDFSVNGGQSYKVSTSTGSALGRGIVGGVLFGGIGALAGASTASKKANPNGKDYQICITTRDLANPMIEYRTKHDTRANELVSVLKIILDSQKKHYTGVSDIKKSTTVSSDSVNPNSALISLDNNEITEDEIEQMCPDYNVPDLPSKKAYNNKKWMVLFSIATLLVFGIAIYLSKGDYASNNTSQSPKSESTDSNPATYIQSNNSNKADRSNDDEYWNSVSRQKALEQMGYEGAANMERNARIEYMRGGGYHAPDGTPQVNFQGSREQAEQLKQMDDLGW